MKILGIDEVGRGPLAGPLVVGAVILPEFEISSRGELVFGPRWIEDLNDSKRLAKKKREFLSEIILKESLASGLGWVPAWELDEVGVSEALRLATKRAVKAIQRLHEPFSQIVIDGKVNFLKLTEIGKYVTTVPRADASIKEVSAASIIAKVARDQYMEEIATKYPQYGFEKHVGYGTAAHIAAINKLGICDEHRKSFEPIKSLVGFKRTGDKTRLGNEGLRSKKKEDFIEPESTTLIGKRGEMAVSKYLEINGHEIMNRNFKTRLCEIDIVSVKDDKIFFTEVKTRKDDVRGGGLSAVDRKKLEKMRFAVDCFLKHYEGKFCEYNPVLAVASVDNEYKVDEWVVID